MGRQADCGIVLPEKTVSRYHCLLDINPPTVKLQDFGSLNGTFLNDVKIRFLCGRHTGMAKSPGYASN